LVTAIIGTGNIGKRVAHDLTTGGQHVVIASRNAGDADAVARDLGPLAIAKPIDEALREADTIVLALWLDVIKTFVPKYADALRGKVVIDPSNPVALDGKGGFQRTLPAGQSAGQIVAALLPPAAHYVKAFGTVAAEALNEAANQKPHRVVLFYATDDETAARTAETLITAAGFDPIKAGGIRDTGRIEVFGDLHQYGGLGKLVTAAEARSALQGVTNR
jgi:predicted dinucleotide-binding enzyme